MAEPINKAFDELNDDIIKASHAGSTIIDPKELAEREEAADAYAGENEKHFVDYYMDCKKTSVEANADIRKEQDDLYKMYKEDEPEFYSQKESWQSKTVIPKPFSAVQFGAASVKKAFTPEFLTITDKLNKGAAEFWQDAMTIELNDQNADFVTRFGDATTMGLAIGDSMEMIPQYTPGVGLRFDLIEPWKIHRDPDALSRDPQSGLFWIHEEWMDYFVLQAGQKGGKYFDVERAKATEAGDSSVNDDLMTKEACAIRKDQLIQRSEFRTMVLTGEFWGSVLSPNGEMLLEKGTYTVAGHRVIEKATNSPYSTLRWPGISFSVLPDLLTFGGRGLLKSVQSLWLAMNQLMCLHEDNYKWVVNPPSEIVVDQLVDPTDVQMWPGKEYLANASVHGNAAVRTVDRRDVSNSILSNLQYYDQNFQRGSFVNDSVQGLPGYRQDMTFRESAQNLNQSLGVFSLMGSNIEAGAKWALVAARDAMQTYAGFSDYERILGPEALKTLGIIPGSEEPGKTITNLPEPSGSFHVSGMQALMREQETLSHLKEVVIPLASTPRFAPYVDPYKTLKALESRIQLEDEGVFVDEETAQQIGQAENEAMKKGEHIKATFTQLEASKQDADVEAVQAKTQKVLESIATQREELVLAEKEFLLEAKKVAAEIKKMATEANKPDNTGGR